MSLHELRNLGRLDVTPIGAQDPTSAGVKCADPVFPGVLAYFEPPQLLIRVGLGLEHDPRGDSAGLDVGDGLVDLVERSRFADHAGLAGGVKLEHLA